MALYVPAFLWQSAHFTGAALPLLFSVLWQSMHSPAVAAGLWKAACKFLVTGGVAGLVWQSVHACCGDLSDFSGFDA
jgi:hypothetical protein